MIHKLLGSRPLKESDVASMPISWMVGINPFPGFRFIFSQLQLPRLLLPDLLALEG